MCGTYYKIGNNFSLSDLQMSQTFIAEIITDTIVHTISEIEQYEPETSSEIHRYLYKNGQLYPSLSGGTFGEGRPSYHFDSSPISNDKDLEIIGSKLLEILMNNNEKNIDEVSNFAPRKK